MIGRYFSLSPEPAHRNVSIYSPRIGNAESNRKSIFSIATELILRSNCSSDSDRLMPIQTFTSNRLISISDLSLNDDSFFLVNLSLKSKCHSRRNLTSKRDLLAIFRSHSFAYAQRYTYSIHASHSSQLTVTASNDRQIFFFVYYKSSRRQNGEKKCTHTIR